MPTADDRRSVSVPSGFLGAVKITTLHPVKRFLPEMWLELRDPFPI